MPTGNYQLMTAVQVHYRMTEKIVNTQILDGIVTYMLLATQLQKEVPPCNATPLVISCEL